MAASALRHEIDRLRTNIEQCSFSSHEERQELARSAKALYTAAEPVEEKAWRIVTGPTISAALFSAIRLGIFQHFTQPTMTAKQVASKTGAEKDLIVRLMRALVVSDIFEEAGEDRYSQNDLSRKFSEGTYQDFLGTININDQMLPHLPDFLESTQGRNPITPNAGLLQFAKNTKAPTMTYFMENPKLLQTVGTAMAATKAIWGGGNVAILSSLFPQDFDCKVLVCDVGGSRGDIVQGLRTHRPDLRGRMVFQDLPPVIAGAETLAGVEGIGYDFFQPQPVKHASVYLLRHVLHDWPDESCKQILGNIVEALGPDSRVVIIDQVIPVTGAVLAHAAVDISMMAFSGMERSVKQWTALLDAVGLKILDIKHSDPPLGQISYDSLIEAVAK